ncbi:hypothetical protein JCM6882_004974 [Rhodosporidiobolus microsporus]
MPTLNALPTELLTHTLSFLDPDSPRRISSRRHLYNCCLVSRRLRDCAQPFLWRQMSTVYLCAAAREADPQGLGRHVRVLDVRGRERFGLFDGETDEPIDTAEVFPLVRLPGVTDVRVSSFEDEWQPIADALFPLLTGAGRIILDTIEFGPTLAPVVFPHLSSLSLTRVWLPDTFLATLFQPSYLPILRYLSVDSFSSIPIPFIRQLSVLQIDVDNCGHFNQTTAELPEALVVSASVGALGSGQHVDPSVLFPIRHLHLRPFHPEEVHASPVVRDCWDQSTLDHLRASYALRRRGLVDLPSFLRRSHLSTLLLPLSLQDPSLTAELQAIVDAFEAKSIEILWEDDEPGPRDVRGLRNEYCRWVGKQKGKQASSRTGVAVGET